MKRSTRGRRAALIAVLALAFFCAAAGKGLWATTAEASTTQPLSNLYIGDRVVDHSWTWEYRQGENYGGWGVTKSVTWIVVAKNHYGLDSGVTLLSEELIGQYTFDDSTSRGSSFGSNNWGESGANNATYGLRPWLNSSGKYMYGGFYYYFSETFKSYVLITELPNIAWSDGTSYITRDRVFIPSSTELGDLHHFGTRPIGTVYQYFSGGLYQSKLRRVASLGAGGGRVYWTRSPSWVEGLPPCNCARFIHGVHNNGDLDVMLTNTAFGGVRAAVNLRSDTPVSTFGYSDGAYTIGPSTPITHTLTVNSTNPDTGVVIASAVPAYGGTTSYTRSIPQGTSFTLTAPGYHGSGASRKRFDSWSGANTSTNHTITLTMSANWSVTANYVNDPVSSLPPRVTLRMPANNARIASRAITFTWNAADRATKYQVQIRRANGTVFKNRALGNVLQLRQAGFPNNGRRFKWRVRAGNESGWGQWSVYRTFRNGR